MYGIFWVYHGDRFVYTVMFHCVLGVLTIKSKMSHVETIFQDKQNFRKIKINKIKWVSFFRAFKVISYTIYNIYGLPCWLTGKETTCQCRRLGFDPYVGKIPWRRKWQSTLIFLPGKSHGQRSLEGYSHVVQESDMT